MLSVRLISSIDRAGQIDARGSTKRGRLTCAHEAKARHVVCRSDRPTLPGRHRQPRCRPDWASLCPEPTTFDCWSKRSTSSEISLGAADSASGAAARGSRPRRYRRFSHGDPGDAARTRCHRELAWRISVRCIGKVGIDAEKCLGESYRRCDNDDGICKVCLT